jgi:hypothetical protein
MEGDDFHHSTKKIEDVLHILIRSRRVRDAIRKEYRRRAPALIAELREGYQGREADRDELEECIRYALSEETLVAAYEAEGFPDPTFSINICGVKEAYFVQANEFDDVGWFTTLADARDYVESKWCGWPGLTRSL